MPIFIMCSDVYPYLRTLCRLLELDFGVVDMRWGVSEETTHEHGTLAMCLSQVDRYYCGYTQPINARFWSP